MPRDALRTAAILAALCALGFLLRTSNAATVLLGDAVVLAENDPYYHLRRVLLILADYPRVPSFDPWIDHPHGAPIVFAPLFDFALATLANVCGLGAGDRQAVETLAAFVPPLLGALTCLPVYAIARRTTSARGAALLAALIAAATPAHVWYSRLGFVDHHVAVTLLATVALALALRALDVRPWPAGAPPAARRSFVTGTVLFSLTVAALVLAWNGGLLPVAIVDASLALPFLAGDAARRRAIATLIGASHGVAMLLVLAVVPSVVRDTGAPWSAVTLSYLHAVLLGAISVVAFAAGALATRRRPAHLLRAAAIGAAMLLALVLLLTRDAAARIAGWLLAGDPFMGAVQESVPILFTSDGRLDPWDVQVWMGRWFLVVPFLLAGSLARLGRVQYADTARAVVLVWAVATFALALLQRRFAESAVPALAVLIADALGGLARWLRVRLVERDVVPATARTLAACAVAAIVVLALWPYHSGFLVVPERLVAVLRAPLTPSAAAAISPADRAEQAASVDVRLHRTLTRLAELERARAAEEGRPGAAMNPWPLGHKLLYVASTPVTTTPFGSYAGRAGFEDSTDFFLARDERVARDILARRGTRWVVVDNDLGTIGAAIVGRGEDPRTYYGREALLDGRIAYAFRLPLIETAYFRLTRLAGSEATVATGGAEPQHVSAMRGLRLVIDSASDDAIGFAKVYEVVPGARVRVQASPGATVVARYEFRSDAGRRRAYEQSARADADGVALLELPYSSERPDLGQTSAWRITADDASTELRVAEDDVRTGRERTVTLE